MTVNGSVVILAHSRSLLVSTEGKHDRRRDEGEESDRAL